jgi:hypothetical protein
MYMTWNDACSTYFVDIDYVSARIAYKYIIIFIY